MTDLLIFLGYVLIFAAVHHNRREDSKINLISWNGLIVFLMVLIGSLLIDKGHEKRFENNQSKIQTEQTHQTDYRL